MGWVVKTFPLPLDILDKTSYYFLYEIFLHENFYLKGQTINSERVRAYVYRVIRALRRFIRAVDIYPKKLNSDLGLTVPQLLCMQALADSKLMTLTDLAKTVNLGNSTANGIIDWLEAKKYLTRPRCVADHRKV